MSVGSALRKRRNELDMTLRELAEEAELTSGFLSQVENDHVSPSLNSLGRIADVLRIPLFHLLSASTGNPVVRAEERNAVPLDGTGIEILLLTPHRNWQMLPFQRSMAAGEVVEAVLPERAREEWIFVLSGTIELVLNDNEPYKLDEGDAIHFESSQLKQVSNPTKGTSTYICMMPPPPV